MTMWVFGYGSLVWNPGFEPVEKVIATLPGYARSFCMRSIHHRGTEEAPGLVLALDAHEGAACTGVALRVAEDQEAAVLDYLRERELISSAYIEEVLPLELMEEICIACYASASLCLDSPRQASRWSSASSRTPRWRCSREPKRLRVGGP